MKLQVLISLTSLGALVALGAFYARSFHRNEKLKIIIYETDDHSTSLQMFLNATERVGLETTVVGQGSDFNGFGSKYVQLMDALAEFEGEPETLIAVIDGRDVLLNVGVQFDHREFEDRLEHFVGVFGELTEEKPEAVLISAEQQCCVAALCHADTPDFYFDSVSGSRKNRACSSGTEDCPWQDNENVKHWQSMMETKAYTRTESADASPYLNAGMMVGTAENLINLIQMMDLEEREDDQAVLSAMYLQFPDLIVLDYEQELLGNNAWPKGLESGCIFDFDPNSEDNAFLTNKETGTTPLLLHTPGKFYSCLDVLIDRLGGVSDHRYMQVQGHRNYGNGNYGNYRPNNYGNYGNYGNSNYGNYGNNYGNYGSAPGNYGMSQGNSNYGGSNGNSNYGGFNYGNSNYGGSSGNSNYGGFNYGNGNYGGFNYGNSNYGGFNYGDGVWNYGQVAPDSPADSNLPTALPTVAPTPSPTAAPTRTPTAAPTNSPTESPTMAPTEAPTRSPTIVPTNSPTESPTFVPTAAPTVKPTEAPTTNPTVMPTRIPTGKPTNAPTRNPTMVPSKMPTISPSLEPTSSPTTHPSQAPTLPPTSVGELCEGSPFKSCCLAGNQICCDVCTANVGPAPTKPPTSTPTSMPTSNPTSPTTEPSAVPTVAQIALGGLASEAPSSSPTSVSPTTEASAVPTVAQIALGGLASETPSSSPTSSPTSDCSGCTTMMCDLTRVIWGC